MKELNRELLDSVKVFIEKYDRLPHFKQDDLEIYGLDEENEEKATVLRAKGQILAVFDDFDEFIEYLYDKNIISYEIIAEKVGFTPLLVENLIKGKTKTPDIKLRRGVENFLGVDYAEKTQGKYLKKCMDCRYKCKQLYFVTLSCSIYKKK